MIYKKIVEIMNELVPKGKIKREEIVPTLSPLLAKHSVVIKPGEITEYKYMEQGASFIVKYELIDAGDNDLQSVEVNVPARRFRFRRKRKSNLYGNNRCI